MAMALSGAYAQTASKKYADAAGADETYVFGIVLGKPISSMSQCPIVPATAKLPPASRRYDVDPNSNSQACFVREGPRIGSDEPLKSESVTVINKTDERPGLGGVHNNAFVVLLVDGVVEQVVLPTGGLPTQEMNYMWLNAYFRATGKLQVHKVRTSKGQELSVWEATWERPKQVEVDFTAASDEETLNKGWVFITTKRSRDREAKQ